MPDRSFAIVAVVAFLAPLLRELVPKLLVPAIVLEMIGGVIVGPKVLGIASTTASVALFANIGLAALLFLAGKEIRVEKLRGVLLERALAAFALSFLLASGVAVALHTIDLVKTPLLVATVLVATSLSIIIVPLRDGHETATPFGQQVIAGAAIAEFGAVIMLSFFFSHDRAGPSTEIVHLCAFVLLAIVVFISVSKGKQVQRLAVAMQHLQEGSAQIQVRADLALLAVVVGLASALGLESILAAFTVGVIRGMTSPPRENDVGDLRAEGKLDAVALGIFVPFFFVSSGMDFNIDQLFASVGATIRLPLFVLGFFAVHWISAQIYRRTMGRRMSTAAGLLQATSFSFVIVATQIGVQIGSMTEATATALVGAGMISVIVFPTLAFRIIESERRQAGVTVAPDIRPPPVLDG